MSVARHAELSPPTATSDPMSLVTGQWSLGQTSNPAADHRPLTADARAESRAIPASGLVPRSASPPADRSAPRRPAAARGREMDANSRESYGGTAPPAPRRPAAARKGILLPLPTGLHPWLPIFRPCGPRVRTGGATRVRPADDPTGTVWTVLRSGRLENRWRFENRNARRKAGSPLESAPYQRATPWAPRRPARRGKAASGQRSAISPQLAVSLAGAGCGGASRYACGSAPACGSKEGDLCLLFPGLAPRATHLSALRASGVGAADPHRPHRTGYEIPKLARRRGLQEQFHRQAKELRQAFGLVLADGALAGQDLRDAALGQHGREISRLQAALLQ